MKIFKSLFKPAAPDDSLVELIHEEARKAYMEGLDMPTVMIYATPYGDVEIKVVRMIKNPRFMTGQQKNDRRV